MTTSPSVEVPLCRPCIGDEEINAVIEVIKSGWMAHGPYNHKFEEAFAAYLGVKHAIVMNSCTSALEVALRVPRIRGEVITPSFTFVATANTCLTSGATPVFCEVDEATRNVTAATIAERITPRTEAVMVVHYGGQVCQMDEIVALCERKGLRLIEDSAETLGATWRGRQAGSFGTGCFSFFPTKNITTGEG
ncbi:MAG: DegT/DnrJ/EryC1/StrS aminotransferase family protein, partial [Myxococcales bacterium]|nr:DegT/DnrJ/EryC1/StrS aminotransferase family protein [Myxococcales bacterium]